METHSNQTYDWNPERMERLEVLYRDGMSFSLIAADIGVSRNAAIGKARRMCLPKRVEIIQSKPNSRRRAPSSKPKNAGAVPMAEKRPVIIPGRDYSCGINELTNRSCRYPLWDIGTPHPQRLYCGVPGANLSEARPYCERHANVVWPHLPK
jgi:hypothetical protein